MSEDHYIPAQPGLKLAVVGGEKTESCAPTTHSRSNGDFPVLAEYPPNGRGCLARFCLCNGVFEPSQPFRPL